MDTHPAIPSSCHFPTPHLQRRATAVKPYGHCSSEPLFLIHRYRAGSVHYVSPNEANLKQTDRMQELGIFKEVHTEIGHIIVASVDVENVKKLLDEDEVALRKLIGKVDQPQLA